MARLENDLITIVQPVNFGEDQIVADHAPEATAFYGRDLHSKAFPFGPPLPSVGPHWTPT